MCTGYRGETAPLDLHNAHEKVQLMILAPPTPNTFRESDMSDETARSRSSDAQSFNFRSLWMMEYVISERFLFLQAWFRTSNLLRWVIFNWKVRKATQLHVPADLYDSCDCINTCPQWWSGKTVTWYSLPAELIIKYKHPKRVCVWALSLFTSTIVPTRHRV